MRNNKLCIVILGQPASPELGEIQENLSTQSIDVLSVYSLNAQEDTNFDHNMDKNIRSGNVTGQHMPRSSRENRETEEKNHA